MKKLTFFLLFLPILVSGQTVADLSTYDPGKPFIDTIQVYALYVTDTLTGEAQTARMSNERKGKVKGYWGSDETYSTLARWKEYKYVEQSRFWKYDGTPIDSKLVLITWPIK